MKATRLIPVLLLFCLVVIVSVGCEELGANEATTVTDVATTVSDVATTAVADATTTTAPTPAQLTYAIGDTGPAGGIVFYDKGDDTGGWRYLEVAPASTEWEAPWGQPSVDLPGADGTAVGTGKQNTADIVAAQGPGSTTAAQLCDGLVFGGYDDWFLPSQEEQDLMYQNLYLNKLGGLQPAKYWGSYERDAEIAWTQLFDQGEQYYGFYKDVTTWVRAVRSF